jgi:hypothetical protein
LNSILFFRPQGFKFLFHPRFQVHAPKVEPLKVEPEAVPILSQLEQPPSQDHDYPRPSPHDGCDLGSVSSIIYAARPRATSRVARLATPQAVAVAWVLVAAVLLVTQLSHVAAAMTSEEQVLVTDIAKCILTKNVDLPGLERAVMSSVDAGLDEVSPSVVDASFNMPGDVYAAAARDRMKLELAGRLRTGTVNMDMVSTNNYLVLGYVGKLWAARVTSGPLALPHVPFNLHVQVGSLFPRATVRPAFHFCGPLGSA